MMTEPKHVVCTIEMLDSASNSNTKCHICSITVKTKANLKAHLIKTHKIIENEFDEAFYRKKKTDNYRLFHCPIENCKYNIETGNGVKKFSILKTHYLWVHKPRCHICSKCNKSFGTAPALKYHEKSCGIRFICDMCGVNFVQKKFLDLHNIRMHIKSEKTLKQNNDHCSSNKLSNNPIYHPVYVPIVLPIKLNESNNLLSKLNDGTLSKELMRSLNQKPETKDAEVQVSMPINQFCPNFNESQINRNYTEMISYVWPGNQMVSVPHCNASMQTVDPSYFYENHQNSSHNDFYNVQTQTLCTPTMPNSGQTDLFCPSSSYLTDAECMTQITSNDWLQLSDNHTQTNTSSFPVDNFVDFNDIQTQTCLKDIEDLLFE